MLRKDNRAIVRAASQASKAADYILGFLPQDQSEASDQPSNEWRAARFSPRAALAHARQ